MRPGDQKAIKFILSTLLAGMCCIAIQLAVQIYFQVNHPVIEEEFKNTDTFRPFRISIRYFFLRPFAAAAFFTLLYTQFEPMISRLEISVPFYATSKGLYFTHVYWVTAVLPFLCENFVTFQISDKMFLFNLLESFLTTTLMGMIVSRVYNNTTKSRFD